MKLLLFLVLLRPHYISEINEIMLITDSFEVFVLVILHRSVGTLQYAIPRLFFWCHTEKSDFYSHLERTWLKIIIITSITWRFVETSPGPCFTGKRIRTNRSSYVMLYFGVTQEKKWGMQLFTVNVIDKENRFDHIETDQPLLNGNSIRTDQGRAIVIHSTGSILLPHEKNNCLKQPVRET